MPSSASSLILRDEMVYELLSEQLQTVLGPLPEGYKCNTQVVSDVVLQASVTGSSVETACADLERTPSGATVRSYLNAAVSVLTLTQLEATINTELHRRLPARLRKRPLELACDFHDEPFYGKTAELSLYAVRGEARAGTTWFYRIATAYVVHHQVPYTLALTFVLPEETPLAVLQRLLSRVQALDLHWSGLYLDKGFAGQAVVTYLTTHTSMPTLIACPIRGKQGGLRAECHGRQSRLIQYTFNANTAQAYTARVALVRTYRKRHGHRQATWLAYLLIHQPEGLKPATVRARYRYRFGIEGSYRSLRQTHASTTSRNPALRFFLLSVAGLILNLWLWLRWYYCQQPRRGGRTVNQRAYTLHRQRAFLRHAIERRYGPIAQIQAQVQPVDV
jgi:hypothetical protein